MRPKFQLCDLRVFTPNAIACIDPSQLVLTLRSFVILSLLVGSVGSN